MLGNLFWVTWNDSKGGMSISYAKSSKKSFKSRLPLFFAAKLHKCCKNKRDQFAQFNLRKIQALLLV